MKIRTDFVTNSSSSSFVINRENITRETLLDIILEIVNITAREFSGLYTLKDMTNDGFYDKYYIIEATSEDPYIETDWEGVGASPVKYDNHFIVCNTGSGRYDWEIVDQVLNKYFILYQYGYCD